MSFYVILAVPVGNGGGWEYELVFDCLLHNLKGGDSDPASNWL